ncbi:MAG: folate-binding protein [Propionibacteriaceae bacterium]|nr:folate-binding protein [Propionibacteriaceae bacterium]
MAQGVDCGLPWHYGSPLVEQRALANGEGVVDVSNREVLRISGPDRLTYLDALGTQRLVDLAAGASSSTYFLDHRGVIQHGLALVTIDDSQEQAVWGWTEPGRGSALIDYLERMMFRMNVSIERRRDVRVVWVGASVAGRLDQSWPARFGPPSCLGGHEVFVPSSRFADAMGQGQPVGLWGHTARRIEVGTPRLGMDTDARTLPNELGVPSEAVSLARGCYPGQETVAKVHNLGAPLRRLVRFWLDGSQECFLEAGSPVTDPDSGATIGRLGSMSYHYELGPIGLGLVARDTDDAATVLVGGVPATLDPLVPRDAGLHVNRAPRDLFHRA